MRCAMPPPKARRVPLRLTKRPLPLRWHTLISAPGFSPISAMRLAKSGVPFISRGDNSGTHIKELEVWKAANVTPNFKGYTSVGQGMGKTLLMANEMQGYTLSDRGTFVAYKTKLDLAVDFDGGKTLANPYQVILINPAKYPDLNHKGAKAFSDWLISKEGQSMINNFKVEGEQLFKATYSE